MRPRAEHRLFLAEGPQAVREALAVPGCVREVFAVPAAADRARRPAQRRRRRRRRRGSSSTTPALASLTETVTPQGLVAVCRLPRRAPGRRPRRARRGCVAVCADVRDPGNAGTVLRCADAAGADGVVLTGASRRPLQRQGRAGLAPARCSTCRVAVDARSTDVVARAARRRAAPCSPPTAPASVDLDDAVDDGPAGRPHRLAVRQRGLGAARRDRRAGRPPGPDPDPRPRREPQPGHRRRGLPLRLGPRPAPAVPLTRTTPR